jgi:hypothetical protein
MRSYVVTQLFSPKAAAAVVVAMALCWGWPVYDGVAQVDGAADDAILTVERCIGSEATIGPLEETLIKEDIIEKDLLQTEVTNVMCKDMLEPAPDGAPLEKLTAAQNYIQEIKLIEGAMEEATNGAAVRGTDRHSSSDDSLVMFQAIGQTSEEVVATHAQYHDGTGGDGTGGDGTGGDGTGGVEPEERQAAAVANAGEDNADSIPESLRQKVEAGEDAGADPPEARAGARCGVEVEVLDEEVKRIEDRGLFEVTPYIPEEIRLREPQEAEEAGLLVRSTTKKEFRGIKREQKAVAGASESPVGCVILTDRMMATLRPISETEALKVDRGQGDDIQELSDNSDTSWSWDIKGRQAGSPQLYLDLKYEMAQKKEFRSLPDSPVYDERIKVTSPAPEPPSAPEPPWWQRIFKRISEFFGA